LSNIVREKTKTIFAKILPVSGTIRRRIFFLLGGMSIGALLVANLIWLPSAIKEIRQAQLELRRVSVQLIRDQMQVHIEQNEADLRNTAQRFRPFLVERDREGLRLTAQRLLHGNSAFEEIGILDGKGKELFRLSRRTVITDRDLIDRSASSLFREGMKQEIYWGAVTITETSEPWVALTVRLPGFDTPLSGLVFGVINLKSLWNLTREFKLSNEGRAYIVEEMGRLIAAADPSVVLRRLSFADRHVIQQLTDPRSSVDRSFVEGNYTNERGVSVTATGLLLSRPRWGVVIEQPRSVLFAPIRQKIWFFASLSFMGLLLSFGLAQILSRRLTEPVVRLREGAEQVGAGNLEYKVSVETNDEIGELARQFNRMAEQLHASQQATLSALTIPVMSQLSEMQEVLDEVIAKVIGVTGAEAASIRIMDDEKREFVFSVYQGFSEAYMHERPTMVKDEAGGEEILEDLEPFISEDILNDSGGNGTPLAREGFRSVVYLPLKTPKKTFGLMTLGSREPGRLSSKKADIFRAVAHQISVALENAHLFSARKQAEEALRESEREALRLARENAVLAEIGRIISSTLNIEEVYERFAKEVHKLIPFDAVAINLINYEEGTITVPFVSEITIPGCQSGEVLPLASSVTGKVMQIRSGLIIQTEDKNELKDLFPTLLTAFDKGLRSLMVVPLIYKDHVIGALHFRSVKSKAYLDKDLRLAERVGNQIAGAIANAQLFAERKQAEEVLQTEKQRFQTLSDNSPFGIIVIDKDFTFKYLNPKFRELFGYDLNDVPDGKTWFRKAYPDPTYRHGVISTWISDLKSYEPGEKIRRTFTVTCKDGMEKVVNFIPILLETGEFLVTCEDVTERKWAEEALLYAAQQWRTTFDSITDFVSLLDLEGNILRCNMAMKNFIGKPFNEISNRPYWEMMLGTKTPIEDCPFLRMKETLRRETTTLSLNERWFNISIDPILDEGGRLIGAVNIISDITEHKRAEKERLALLEQLQQSQKMEAIGQLAGGVAHDFNNLLTVIRGYSQFSLGELPKGTPLWENIEEIRHAADRATDLTRQLLAFSRRQILEFKTVNLNNLIQAMEKMLRRMIGEDIELIIHGAENLGSIKTDPGQMEQVIMNLAVNARDAMPSGGKLILETDNVYLDEEYAQNQTGVKPGYYVKLSISDTGCGMTPEIKERVFEPFFTTKEKGKGTGLGLSTVYGIVKQSDGNILVYSEPGKGTTFNTYLPRMDEPVEVLRKKGELKEVPRGNETVFVVEDEEAVRNLAVRILKKQGYKVLEATRGDEALLALERHPEPIHLILTDVVMPGMSGPKLVEGLRQIRGDFKAIYMSGYTDDSVIRHGVREGEVNFVQKPFTLEMLGRKVREVLDNHS
jgi:two-component system cell cycle sensor histidine kinase/response regulator CckA